MVWCPVAVRHHALPSLEGRTLDRRPPLVGKGVEQAGEQELEGVGVGEGEVPLVVVVVVVVVEVKVLDLWKFLIG